MRQYEADTWYDANGRIVFTASKALPGVGLPRNPIRGDGSYTLDTPTHQDTNIALGWEDVRHIEAGAIRRRVTDNTQPGGPFQRWIEYVRSVHPPRPGTGLSDRMGSVPPLAYEISVPPVTAGDGEHPTQVCRKCFLRTVPDCRAIIKHAKTGCRDGERRVGRRLLRCQMTSVEVSPFGIAASSLSADKDARSAQSGASISVPLRQWRVDPSSSSRLSRRAIFQTLQARLQVTEFHWPHHSKDSSFLSNHPIIDFIVIAFNEIATIHYFVCVILPFRYCQMTGLDFLQKIILGCCLQNLRWYIFVNYSRTFKCGRIQVTCRIQLDLPIPFEYLYKYPSLPPS